MKKTGLLRSWLVVLSVSGMACGNDLGTCDSPSEGRDTVVVSGSVQFAGQAILNRSCANNVCHASKAKGAGRNGAPAGLDFDLVPVRATEEDEIDGRTVGKLSDAKRAGLRQRQRQVVEQRFAIWEQVKSGLMPPGGRFAELRNLLSIVDSEEQSPCEGAEDSLEPITTAASQELLRNWLACGAPIVESNNAIVSARTAGSVGYQYPLCEGAGDSSTIEGVQSIVFDTCAGCHPSLNEPDLGTAEKSYAAFVEDQSVQCDGKPYVTKGDASRSFLYDLLSKDDPGCGKSRMPLGGELAAEDLKAVQDWIEGGALRASDL